jgi:hypothetical protein
MIVDETHRRLILRESHRGLGIAALGFTTLSALAFTLTLAVGIERLGRPEQTDLYMARLLTLVIFLLIEATFVAMGALSAFSFLIGQTLIFDKDAETVTISGAQRFRRRMQSLSIYSIDRLDVEPHAESRVFRVYLRLRSGERVPLAAVPHDERDQLEGVAARVRGFLRA